MTIAKSEAEIKAVTSESSSGEISCSIDETNRVRALLGLKPLNLGPGKEAEAVNNFKKKRQEEVAAAEAQALHDRLEKAKEKRLLHAVNTTASTLGDTKEPGDKDLISAADWVRRSRTIEVTQKEKARLAAVAAAARQAEEDEEAQQQAQQSAYGNRDLAGLGIQHNASEFNEGEEVVLTLADAPLLETDKVSKQVKGLHGGEDALENVNIAADERRRDALKRIQRSKRPAYSGYDDDEFDLPGGGGYLGPGGGMGMAPKRKILSQYDDAPAVPTTRIVLGEEGQVSSTGAAVKQENAAYLPVSLRAAAVKEAEAYYTQTEYAAFNKPKGEKKLRKKRKIREKGDGEEEEGAYGLEAALQQTSAKLAAGGGEEGGVGENEANDFGSRRKAAKHGVDASDESVQRMKSYQNAVLAAGRKSALAFSSASLSVRGEAGGGGELLLAEEAELTASLQRAQRLAGRAADASAEDSGAAWAKQHAVIKQERMDVADESGAARTAATATLDSQGRKADGTLVFTSTTAFSSRMLAGSDERARDAETRYSAAAAKGGKASSSSSVVIKRESGGQLEMEVEDVESDAEDIKPSMSGSKASHYQSSDALGIVPQPVVAGSMAATLALLKGSGDLKASDARLVGRSKDKRTQDPSARDFNVNLDYTDEHGNKLTQKEAFRQINYAFHGIAPGIKAQEKRLRALEREQAQGTSKEGDTGAMKSLLDAQKATGSAHVVVSGPSKTGRQQDTSVVRLAHEIHAKRLAYKEKQAAKAAAAAQK